MACWHGFRVGSPARREPPAKPTAKESVMSHSIPQLPWAAASVVAAVLAAPLASAQSSLEAVAVPAHGRSIAAHLHDLPPARLEAFYLACSDAALAGRLGHGELAVCSMGYETLLQRRFGGDFTALLAWSRRQAAAAR
jgi:hypothetical protein